MSGEDLLLCLGRHSLRPENGVESPRQVQSRHDLVFDQRLSAARPEPQGPVSDEIGGTHQSGLGTEGVHLLWSLHHRYFHREGDSRMSGKLTKPALNLEEPTPVGACPWGGAIARGTEHPYVRTSCVSVPTPLN